MNTSPFVFSTISIPNFSYRIVNALEVLVIPYAQQMSVYQELTIVDSGELDVEGEVVIYE